MSIRFWFSFLLIPLSFALCASTPSFAQTNQPTPTLILTWQAHSFVPSSYPGKVLPARDSSVDLALEFIVNGKITPLTDQTVRWTVNDRFLAANTSLTNISFKLDQFTTRTYTVTATVKDYQGQDFQKSVVIRRADPLVVIEAPYLAHTLNTTSATFTATPYFFTPSQVSDLFFSWAVSGLAIHNQSPKITLSLSPQTDPQSLSVSATITNRLNPVESANATEQFVIQK